MDNSDSVLSQDEMTLNRKSATREEHCLIFLGPFLRSFPLFVGEVLLRNENKGCASSFFFGSVDQRTQEYDQKGKCCKRFRYLEKERIKSSGERYYTRQISSIKQAHHISFLLI